jgi:FkbM family methyltransferase
MTIFSPAAIAKLREAKDLPSSEKVDAVIDVLLSTAGTAPALTGTQSASDELYAVSGIRLVTGPYGSFIVFDPDIIGGVVGRGEFWDVHLKSYMDKYADKNLIAIDAGAYIGFHSVYLAKRFKALHSFEPQKRCFTIVKSNLALNHCDNATVHNQCLYNERTTLALAPQNLQHLPLPLHESGIDYQALGNAGALSFNKPQAGSFDEVIATPLDDFNLKNVGFIKIDTQGSDLKVLLGAQDTIAWSRPIIAFEYEEDLSSHHGNTLSDYRDFFAARQYTITTIAGHGKQQDFICIPDEKV